MTIHVGDCIEVMAGMPADSVDAIVTDPPYGLEFMGKEWDKFAVSPTTKRSGWAHTDGGGTAATRDSGPRPKTPHERTGVAFHKRRETAVCRECGRRDAFRNDHGHGDQWDYIFVDPTPVEALTFQAWCTEWGREALRVTKPGGYLLAFGGTRTHHRLVCGLEDAGWIIRDELDWIYASGFPKGKANLKPAHEPIVLARKPGPLRPLNIDQSRISMPAGETLAAPSASGAVVGGHQGQKGYDRPWKHDPEAVQQRVERAEAAIETANTLGRWPSNLLLSDPELFDEPNPWVVGSGATASYNEPTEWRSDGDGIGQRVAYQDGVGARSAGDVRGAYGDSGGYSRFFIVPKADRADREPVLRGQLEARQVIASVHGGMGDAKNPNHPRENSHATVKPTDLMRHLIRLVTPPGGTVLDPFLGSGSTAIAAELEGFPWIGIEKEPEYVAIAEARLNGTQRGLGLDTPLVGEPRKSVDGVAVRHRGVAATDNVYGGGVGYHPPGTPDMTYRQPRPPKPEKPTADTAPLFGEEPAA